MEREKIKRWFQNSVRIATCFRHFWNTELSSRAVGLPAVASSAGQPLGSSWKAKREVAEPRRVVLEGTGVWERQVLGAGALYATESIQSVGDRAGREEEEAVDPTWGSAQKGLRSSTTAGALTIACRGRA